LISNFFSFVRLILVLLCFCCSSLI